MQEQQQQNNCLRHPHNQIVGICLNKDFLHNQEIQDWRVCSKCMSIYSKIYNDFLLLEDLNDKNEFQIEEYPFDVNSRRIKTFLIEKQIEKKKIFTKELEQIDQLIDHFKDLKTQLLNIQDGYDKIEESSFQKLHQSYSDVYNLQPIKDALKRNDGKYSENKEIDELKHQLHRLFNNILEVKESKEIKQQIHSFTNGANNFIQERLQPLIEQQLSNINQLNLDQLKISQTHLQLVQLLRSRVPYPDALNTILYSKESLKEDSCSYKLIFQKNEIFEEKCHFFIGCIDSELKDTVGYNHDMPCICIFCHLKKNDIHLSSLKSLSVLIQFDFKLNSVTFNFEDIIQPLIISYHFQPLKDWKFFISMCFPLKFKLYSC